MALIYIVEDDESISEIETIALKNSGHNVFTFTNAKLFFDKIETILPDLIILDLMLPDKDGNEIVKELKNNPETKMIPVMMVTAKTSELDMVKGLENGADDYIKKPFSVIELVTRVKVLLRRNQKEDQDIILDNIVINQKRRQVSIDDHIIELTYKEYELLKYLMINQSIVVTRESIMDHVWKDAYYETRTVDAHIKTLRRKLGPSGNHIRTVRNVGYVIE